MAHDDRDRRDVAPTLVAARQRRRAVLIGAARHRFRRYGLVALRREDHHQKPEGHGYRTDLDDLAFLVGGGDAWRAHGCFVAIVLCSAFSLEGNNVPAAAAALAPINAFSSWLVMLGSGGVWDNTSGCSGSRSAGVDECVTRLKFTLRVHR